MQTLSEIKSLLAARGLSPRKSLGQNFLVDKNLIGKLIDAAAVGPGDLVVEVGPGTGTLTEALLERGCEVIACELDRGLAELLRERIPTVPGGGGGRFSLVEGDCLRSGRQVNAELVEKIGGRPFKVVANLPYGAATPFMLAVLIEHAACSTIAVTIQKEVVDRLVAERGNKDYGTLGIVVQTMAEVERVAKLPKECFWPQPDVTSAMCVLHRRAVMLTADAAALTVFAQALFSKRRKQLGAVVGQMADRARLIWPSGAGPTMRAEELSPTQFEQLRLAVQAAGGDAGLDEAA